MGTDIISDEPLNSAPRRYYLLPELRRSAMWAIGGFILIAICVWVIGVQFLQRDVAGAVVATIILICGAAWLAQYVGPVIRVDDNGISRISCWRWDCWTWESFAEGRIRYGFGRHSYEDPARPWWRRKLQLGLLAESDANSITSLVRKIWTPPAPEPVPETVSFRIGWPDRRRVVMTTTGLTVSSKREEHAYRWDEVDRLIVWRLEADRPDFREIELRVGDQQLQLRRFSYEGNTCENWAGASPESIAAALCQWVSVDRRSDFALTGTSRTLAELDARQERLEQSACAAQRNSLQLRWVGAIPIVAAIPMALFDSWQMGVLIGLTSVPFVLVSRHLIRNQDAEIARQRHELETQRAGLRAVHQQSREETRRAAAVRRLETAH